MLSAFIITVLERHNGNRTRTSHELKIPLRTLRAKLNNIRSLGYSVPEYQYTREEE